MGPALARGPQAPRQRVKEGGAYRGVSGDVLTCLLLNLITFLCNFLRFLLSFCYIYEIPMTPCSEFNTPAPGQGTRQPGANIPGNTAEEWPGWRAGTLLHCLSLSHTHVHMRHTQHPAGSHVQGPRSTPASSVQGSCAGHRRQRSGCARKGLVCAAIGHTYDSNAQHEPFSSFIPRVSLHPCSLLL